MASYITSTDVIDGLLQGYTLQGVVDVGGYIDELLPASKQILDNSIGRDWDDHTGDVVTLDGNNSDRITLWKDDVTLCVPIIAVGYVKVYGSSLSLTALKFTSAGVIGFQNTLLTERLAMRRALNGAPYIFPADFQNVEVQVDWGYVTPPDEVKVAQAYVTAAMALANIGGVLSGGAQRVKIRDFERAYGNGGPYGSQVRRWLELAELMCERFRTGRQPG